MDFAHTSQRLQWKYLSGPSNSLSRLDGIWTEQCLLFSWAKEIIRRVPSICLWIMCWGSYVTPLVDSTSFHCTPTVLRRDMGCLSEGQVKRSSALQTFWFYTSVTTASAIVAEYCTCNWMVSFFWVFFFLFPPHQYSQSEESLKGPSS